MEGRDSEDFQWLFMADPTVQNQQHPFPNHGFQINGASHVVSSNPNFFQESQGLRNHDEYLFQNLSGLSGSQRYHHPITRTLQQGSLPVYEGLEDSFSRMNLNHSPPLINSDLLLLQRARVESAVRGQMGFYDLEGNFGGRHSNSARSFGNQNMVGVGAMTRSGNLPGVPMEDNGFDNINSRRRSLSFEELDYACRRRLINNSNHLRRYWDSTWAVNGFESENSSSNLLPSMKNHRVIYPQQRLKYSSLGELKGRVPSVAKDQSGCRFLQKKFDHEIIKREEIDMIFLEVKDHLHELMVHQFANYLIQKLFKACNQDQRTELLLLLVSSEQRFLEVCTDVHGTRAVQKFMERISTQEQRAILLSVLKPVVVTLTKDSHGHHIIEQCLNKFSNEDTKHLMDEIVEHSLDIATNQSGCCVMQQCLAHAKGEARERLLAEITANALVLSENSYGNYVVQYVLGMRIPYVTSNIIAQLEGNYITLSVDKQGSNVVEKCLKDGAEEESARIITEIMNDTDFLKVLQNPFGNYVAQSALQVAKGALYNALADKILQYYPFLHSHLYGKKVLAVLARTRWRKNRV